MWPNNPMYEPIVGPGVTKEVERLGRRVPAGWVEAVVYKTDDDYYFSCETCGNSGQHWHGKDYAVVQALHHVIYFDHAPYLEDSHE